MPFPECRLPRRARTVMAALCAALLAACGGDGNDNTGGNPPAASCSVDEQKATLRSYFDDWYFWYKLAPNPSPAAYASVADYFDALLYAGVDPAFPKDRWSNFESTESFNRFFGDGKSLGYGVSVAGLEVTGLPDQPLYVRYIEPLSPAATAGIVRGDQVLSINGRSAAEILAAAEPDFSELTADAEGQTLTLVLRNAGGDRTVTLSAAVYALSPVSRASVVTTPLGRKLGYVVMKDMISQSLAPLDNAFADFKAQGVSDVVLDLRYNGGGLVSVASSLAAYVGGAGASGKTFATLLYNDKRASNNSTFRFANPASALGVSRVYVLTGRRTCSASEQVINGLRGVGIEVIAIGETTCGKPVGFLPTDLNQCGTTYSVVNFESVNARNEGRYFDGFDATCVVGEDWSKPLGANDEPLLATARLHADTGACPGSAAREAPLVRRSLSPRKAEPGERSGMLGR